MAQTRGYPNLLRVDRAKTPKLRRALIAQGGIVEDALRRDGLRLHTEWCSHGGERYSGKRQSSEPSNFARRTRHNGLLLISSQLQANTMPGTYSMRIHPLHGTALALPQIDSPSDL